MNCFVYDGTSLMGYDTLRGALELDGRRVITITGAGGKTTVIKRLAREFADKKVFVTTSTHMMSEAGCIVNGSAADMLDSLKETGFCFAGTPLGRKIGALEPETFELVSAAADITLIEGDGSRRLAVKYPANHEPVIMPQTTDIAVIMGLSALGKPAGAAMHRYGLYGAAAEDIINEEMTADIIRRGYINRLNSRIYVILNQADTEERLGAAVRIGDMLGERIVITSFAEEERNDI